MVSNLSTIANFLTMAHALKAGFLIIMVLYIIFTLIVFKQITSMDDIIREVHSSIIIKVIAIINIVFALSLFLAAVVIL